MRGGRVQAGRALLLAALTVSSGAVARGDAGEPPPRGGFTAELGLGLAHARAMQGYDPGRAGDGPGLVPLAAGAGGFVTPRLALLGRASVTQFLHDRGDGRRWYLLTFAGAVAQYWARPDLSVSGGLGVGLINTPPRETYFARGLAGSLRAGYRVGGALGGSLVASWELQPTVYLNYEVTLASLLLLQWQRD
jgi:hypothetical protein